MSAQSESSDTDSLVPKSNFQRVVNANDAQVFTARRGFLNLQGPESLRNRDVGDLLLSPAVLKNVFVCWAPRGVPGECPACHVP